MVSLTERFRCGLWLKPQIPKVKAGYELLGGMFVMPT